jgi:outer membrane protein insertion porin family
VISGRRSQIDLSFTEPYFLDRPLAAGFDVFRTDTNRRESSFDEKNLGGGLRLGYDITEFLRQTVRYTISRNEILDVDSDASVAIQQQRGTTISSVIGQDLTYDRRDNRLDPREGYFVRLRNDLAGLGGDVSYLRSRLGGGYYQPLGGDFVAALLGEIGYVFGIGEDVRITDNFFLGGNSFLGFQTAGIGPRDVVTEDALGGNKFFVGTTELSFPLGLPEEFQIRGRVFSDFGTLADSDFKSASSVDEASLRVSVGTGLSWKSPLGPIAVDFAVPVIKESFDQLELFRFSVGTRF